MGYTEWIGEQYVRRDDRIFFILIWYSGKVQIFGKLGHDLGEKCESFVRKMRNYEGFKREERQQAYERIVLGSERVFGEE